ncbi:MAG: DUF2183 domain-containing protein [Cryobacterium sp.]|nr:DUF2183 domain-containing protein [Oligoflexia bacterium]
MKNKLPPFLVVSDLDDTLKISHTTNRLRLVFRGLFTQQTYAGMAELFQEWTGDRPFILLSSSPIWIRKKIARFLDYYGFPEREIWLRDWIKEKDIKGFKSAALDKIEARGDSGFIFIGDDAEYDPEVFARFRERNPDRTLAIYIRRMRGRPLPAGVIPFHSAFEIAISELDAGRLNVSSVTRVGKAIIDERVPEQVIPYFAAPPIDLEFSDRFPTLEKIIEGLNLQYEKIRLGRKIRK